MLQTPFVWASSTNTISGGIGSVGTANSDNANIENGCRFTRCAA